MSILRNIKEISGNIVNTTWIEWVHPLIPNEPEILREAIRIAMAIKHCLICTRLDGCYFLESNMPELPLHPYCDCYKENISSDKLKNATAYCPISKFKDYIFTDEIKSKGKMYIFTSMGFSSDDSYTLSTEFERQALSCYLNGNYSLDFLDQNGQRIGIPITLNNHMFWSGWMVYPNGKIQLVTPFGGWIDEF
ncbi:MAG: hypothetical protein IJS74_02620 [Clostridia bacterium]|nr:hypothetical protein [Clostridia bacterium]